MRYHCEHCGKELSEDYKPALCCDGYMCGCMGRPIEPMVCSQDCFNAIIKPKEEKDDDRIRIRNKVQ
jgi:hypothetical protein